MLHTKWQWVHVTVEGSSATRAFLAALDCGGGGGMCWGFISNVIGCGCVVDVCVLCCVATWLFFGWQFLGEFWIGRGQRSGPLQFITFVPTQPPPLEQ